ncbi:MAG: molybdopterin synthase catalytic subunit MoaE [Oceanospirillaceae bacterium]|nr:molybdopterin synthase catalytic subunit MoaE [Oceanospirillaceae bacterium]
MGQTEVRVQRETFDLIALDQLLQSDGARCGAVVTFTGRVRDLENTELRALELEHYPGMTERALASIVDQARERWSLGSVVVIHRVGRLEPGDPIVFVGVASAHREAAFEAARFIMDYLKRDAPLWKKEVASDGERWVDQKDSDLNSADAWCRGGGDGAS